jgi:hypothetical protein
MNLNEMPLDSPEHIRLAWHMVTGMDWRRHKAAAAGDPPDPFLPGEHELGQAIERIQAAAAQHNVEPASAFTTPKWRTGQEPLS